MSTRDPRSTVEMLTYAAAWFDDLDELTATFARITGQQFQVERGIQRDLLALARWMAEHSDANDEAFAYVQRNEDRPPERPVKPPEGSTDTPDTPTGAHGGAEGDYGTPEPHPVTTVTRHEEAT